MAAQRCGKIAGQEWRGDKRRGEFYQPGRGTRRRDPRESNLPRLQRLRRPRPRAPRRDCAKSSPPLHRTRLMVPRHAHSAGMRAAKKATAG